MREGDTGLYTTSPLIIAFGSEKDEITTRYSGYTMIKSIKIQKQRLIIINIWSDFDLLIRVFNVTSLFVKTY